MRRDAVALGHGGDLPRPVGEALPLRCPREEGVEGRLDDLGVGRAGLRVGEGVAGGRELLEEARRDGEVEAGEVLGERLDVGARSPARRGRRADRLERSGRDFNW
jgi:hypothetical protein